MIAAIGNDKQSDPSTSSSVQWSQQCRHFKFPEILLATENFDESLVIGRGGFGKVYRGTILNGSATVLAAIKRLDPSSNQGAPEFWAEVEMLSKLRHCNLVSLFGYCNDEEEMILVYEYMPNGTLEDHLHKLGTPLSWVERLKICLGAGRGLHYLHTGTGIDIGVIHRDVKTSNILLQESWAAKISDFGLSKISPTNQPMTHVNTLVKGTFGYFDPDYYATGNLTRKSDVYAFGVVLLEVLCRKRAIFNINGEASNLANWAQESIKEGSLKNIIDFDIRGQVSPKCSKEFVRITERCLHRSPKKRSTMAEVLFSLESILNLQEKFNNSVQPAGRTILDRMVNMLPFPSNGENIGIADWRLTQAVERKETNGLRTFTFAELRRATNYFSEKDYSTTFGGTIYKGWVDKRTYAPTESGIGLRMYVTKRLTQMSKLNLKAEEYNHPNIVKLLGYCLNKKVLFCVYEHIPDPSLDKLLFGEPSGTSLSLLARLKIAVGVAHGLSFAHQRRHLAYTQFKTNCILVDMDYNARLWDFNVKNSFLARGSYSFRRDAPYAAPEWFRYQADVIYDGIYASPYHNHSGVKSEIYAFGVVLLELLTGMKVYDDNRPEGKKNLVKWAIQSRADEEGLGMIIDPPLQHDSFQTGMKVYDDNRPEGKKKLVKWAIQLLKDEEDLGKSVDPHLQHESFLQKLVKWAIPYKLASLVSKCLHPSPEKRPPMEEIYQVLNHCYLEETEKSLIPECQTKVDLFTEETCI